MLHRGTTARAINQDTISRNTFDNDNSAEERVAAEPDQVGGTGPAPAQQASLVDRHICEPAKLQELLDGDGKLI